MIIGNLGSVLFEVSADRVRTFQTLSRQTPARVAVHEVIGAAPVVEYLGPGSVTASLSISLRRQLGVNVRADIAAMRGYCTTGEAVALIIGGQPLGNAGALWIVESMTDTWERVTAAGEPDAVDVELTLREYQSPAPPRMRSQRKE